MRPSAHADRERVAVLGAGTMAPGIAAAFAVAGHDVVLWSRRPEAAAEAHAEAGRRARFLVERELAPGPAPDDAFSVAERLDDVAGVDVVVEAIAEQLQAKRDLLAQLEALLRPDALVATNTSGLRVTDIAAELAAPERVVAMHFWNPAHLMPIVEVGGGERTAPETVERAVELARAIGKQPVRVEREVLGFLGTRLQQAVVREAIDLDRSTEPQPALRERVAAGDLGVKSGRGFHDWGVRDADDLIRRRDEELVRRLRLTT